MLKDFTTIILFITTFYSTFRYLRLKRLFTTQQKEFLTTLSHDLKVSILAQIRGLNLLTQSSNFDLQTMELINEINQSCQYTFDMITMLQNTYRHEVGKTKLNFEDCNIDELFNSLSSKLYHKLNEKNLSLILPNSNDNIIKTDINILTKSLKTLLITSIDYSMCNKQIFVNTKNKENDIEVTISFYGKSLSMEDCKKIFCINPKYSAVGHGIQMHLCKKNIELLGGNIQVVNNDEHWNTFMFRFPKSKNENKLFNKYTSKFISTFFSKLD